jgi:hypothetical protein
MWLAALGFCGVVAAASDDLETLAATAAAHALEAMTPPPWTRVVVGEGEVVPGALQLILDDKPSVYAPGGCEDPDALPRICEGADGVLTCSAPALQALADLDPGRGHPGAPMLALFAHEIGLLVQGRPQVLTAEDFQLDFTGMSPEARIEAIGAVLDRQAEAEATEAAARSYAEALLGERLIRPPYRVRDDETSLVTYEEVLRAAGEDLRAAGACLLDEIPEAAASERDIQRRARRLLCAASKADAITLGAFAGSHPYHPALLGHDYTDTADEYAAIAAAMREQLAALPQWPPDCGAGAMEAYLSVFDDTPQVCPRLPISMEPGSWRPVTRMSAPAEGGQLAMRGLGEVGVLGDGRVAFTHATTRRVGIWDPASDTAEMMGVPCEPQTVVDFDGALAVACQEPAGVVELRDGQVRIHELLSEQPLSPSWVGSVAGRLWVTGERADGASFGLSIKDWAVSPMPAWQTEGCEALLQESQLELWWPDGGGEVHGLTGGGAAAGVMRFSPVGAFEGRTDPQAWIDEAEELELLAGVPLACGPAHGRRGTVCVDNELSVFEPLRASFELDLNTWRRWEGPDPAADICDTKAGSYLLVHDRNGPEQQAWVVRYSAGGSEELIVRSGVKEAHLLCGPERALLVLDHGELTRITPLD